MLCSRVHKLSFGAAARALLPWSWHFGISGWVRTAALLTLFGLLALYAQSAAADSCELSLGSYGRWYPDNEERPRSYTTLSSIGGAVACEVKSERSALKAKVFGRLAQHGSARSHADVREFVWTVNHDPWQFRVGFDQVYWGVTEFANLIDIINQSDLLEDPFGDAKFGQPMVVATARPRWGTVSVYALPGFRDRIFPDRDEPMRSAPATDLGPAEFESSRGRKRIDWAVRYALTQGPVDLGLSYFEGTSRDPTFVSDGASEPRVHALHDLISQAGLDLQVTLDKWVFKVESARRHQRRDSVSAYAVGTEYTLVGVAGTPADITIAAEYMRDYRNPAPPPSFLDDEIAVGMRMAINDSRSTEARLGVIVDRNHDSQAWAIDISTRIQENWSLNLQSRLFNRVPRIDPLQILRPDTYFELSLTRYFLTSNR